MTSRSVDAAGGRLRSIDGLRGLAALAVALFHLGFVFGAAPLLGAKLPRPLRVGIGTHGRLGVAVFFVLSGYVISMTVPGSSLDVRSAGRFLARRLGRILPPYWASIPVAIIAAVGLWLGRGGPLLVESKRLSIGRVAAHLLLLQDALHVPALNEVYWSLYFEVAYYIMFAAAAVAATWAATRLLRGASTSREASARRWLIAALLGGLSLFGMWFPFLDHHVRLLPFSFLTALFAFFLGVLAHWTVDARASGVETRSTAVALLVMSGVVLASGTVTEMPFKIVSVATVVLLVFGRGHPAVERALSVRPLQFLGRISFSLYLTHTPVYAVVLSAVYHTIGTGSALNQLVFVMLAVPASIVAAVVFHRVVEVPSIRLSRRLVATPVTNP